MTDIDDEQLLRQFEDCTLPKAQWTHAAHVRVTYLYLRQRHVNEVIDTMRSRIKALNAAQGTQDTPTGGYHETITQAWVRVIADLMTRHTAETSTAFFQSQVSIGQSKMLGQFYSHEVLMSPIARAQFVEPDLAPLP